MNRSALFSITVTACLLAANAFAQGATDKVTGEYTRAGCNNCQPGDVLNFVGNRLISAHEASSKHPQKGFFLSWNDAGRWFALDFTDTLNTCVNVYEDGRARIGGLIEDGNGPQVGRVFGFYLEDHGGPAYFSDNGHTVRFALDYEEVDEAREDLMYWCATGMLPEGDQALDGLAVWPGIVIDGNLVVHN
ncbi:MAG: hypothetical protein KJO01_00435 [Gammaproteobacteria bacterium]|nr:hypothetical protein [Gammaproteobacteria bacterium]